MSLRAKYYDVPSLSAGLITMEGNGGQSFSSPYTPLTGYAGLPFAAPETGGWPLDGSRRLLHNPRYWWSQQRSDDTGVLTQPAVLTLTTPMPITATGLTFTFWPATNEWCSQIRIHWYNGTQLLHSAEAYPDSPYWVLSQTVENFDKLCIELRATNLPGKFAKLEKLELGQIRSFEEKDLISVELINEIDPLLGRLKTDRMEMKLRNPLNTPLRPLEKQAVVLYRDDEPIVTHYITSSSQEAKNTYTLQTQSTIGLLGKRFFGGMYRDVSVNGLLLEICNGYPFELDPAYWDTLVSGYLPICTCRQALQQVAFAIGAAVSTREDGSIFLGPLAQEVESVLSEADIFGGVRATTQPCYHSVEVAAHSYTPNQQDRWLLDQEPINGSDVLITFDEPHHSYQISGGVLMDSGANYVRISAQGPVTLIGRDYVHTVQLYSKPDSKNVGADGGNVLQVNKATMVHSGNVQTVLDQLYATAQLRQTVEMDAVIRGQRAGQKVVAATPWGDQIQGYISAMHCRLTPKGQTAAIKLVGTQKEAE